VDDPSGEVIAVGTTSDGGLFRSPDGSWSVSVRVAPEWRRRGVGRALLGALEGHAHANGSKRTVASTRATDPDGARFAEANGYRAFHERIDSYIDVNAFDASPFEDPDVVMTRIGIRLATYGELLGEHASDVDAFHRALFTSVWPIVRDVPSPMPLPETPPPFEQARIFFGGPGMEPATSVTALRDGAIVGLTLTAVKENGTAYTNLTGVARAERGKGIALAMKLRALRTLNERGVKLFGTTNDEQNAAMRGINKKLGYVPDPPTIMYAKKLT
jgi:GNAT superfamily N-acetyltransferase